MDSLNFKKILSSTQIEKSKRNFKEITKKNFFPLEGTKDLIMKV